MLFNLNQLFLYFTVIIVYKINMNKSRFFLLFIFPFLINLTYVKTLQEHPTLKLQQQKYLNALTVKETDVQKEVQNLTKQIQSVKQKIQSVSTLPNMKIIALEEGLADQRDTLYTIQQLERIPISLKTNKCHNLTEIELKNLKQDIVKLQNQLAILQKKINTLKNNKECSLCKEIMKQYQWNKIYLQQLKTLLDPCPYIEPKPTPINNHMNISNLLAPNWIYGNITESEYITKILQQKMQFNITTCHLSTPFVQKNQKFCSNCLNNTYFDLSQQQCVTCPKQTKFESLGHKCISNQISTLCQNGKYFDFSKKKCQCPFNAPYFNDKICVNCEQQQFFNETLKNCHKCLNAQFAYNKQTKQCEACPKDKPLLIKGSCHKCPQKEFYDQKTKKCEKCTGYQERNQEANQCQCPEYRPHFNGEQCIQCNPPKFFNQTTKKCQSCQNNTVYKFETQSCGNCPQQAPVADGQICVACPNNQYFNKELNKCESCPPGKQYIDKECRCPTEKPYYDKKQCISCILPKYWDVQSLTCKFCSLGYFYENNKTKCTKCPSSTPRTVNGQCQACPSFTVYNTLTNYCDKFGQQCPSNKAYSFITNQCQCPPSLPFWNNLQCVSCILPKYWNYDNLKCEDCGKFQHFNPVSKKCQYCTPSKPVLVGYICSACHPSTIFQASQNKCIQPKNTKQEKCIIPKVYDVVKNGCVCHISQPFDAGHNICKNCFQPNYWDYIRLECLTCPDNKKYDKQQNLCI